MVVDLWNTTEHPGLCNPKIIDVSLKCVIIGFLSTKPIFVDDKVTPGPWEDPATVTGPWDCVVTPVLFAASCPCLSGDPTEHLLDAVPEPNPNVQSQLQEGGAGASATKERFSGLFSNGKASHAMEVYPGAGL